MNSENRILVVVDPTASANQACVGRAAQLAKKLDLGIELLICHYEQFLTGARSANLSFKERSRADAILGKRKLLEEIAEPLRSEGLDVLVSAVWDRPLAEGIVRHVLRTQPRLVIKETHYHNALSRAMFTHTDWTLVRTCPVPLWLAKPHAWPEGGKVLACVDPSHMHDKDAELDTIIMQEASILANNLSGELHAFHAYPTLNNGQAMSLGIGIGPMEEMQKDIEQDHQERFNKLLADYPHITAGQTHMLCGDPGGILPELTDELGVGLVVMGAIARNRLQRIFVGSTSEQVLDKLPCDLLIMKPAWFASPIGARPPSYYDGTREELPVAPNAVTGPFDYNSTQESA